MNKSSETRGHFTVLCCVVTRGSSFVRMVGAPAVARVAARSLLAARAPTTDRHARTRDLSLAFHLVLTNDFGILI